MLRRLALVSLCSLPLVAQPTVVRLTTTADASADADQPSVNFGSSALVTCGKTFTNTPTFRVWLTRGHFLFDLTALQGLGTPSYARLRLYQAQANAAGCLETSAHQVTSSWSEATLTWQNKPTHVATALSTACVGDSFAPGWKSYEVTAAVQAWLRGAPNFGLVVRDPSESLAGAARPLEAASREGSNPAQAPTLEVYYATRPFGAGCSPNTVPGLELDAGTPARGDTYTLRASGLPNGAPLMMLFGLSDQTWNGVPLPFSLAGIGLPNCSVLVAGDLLLLANADRFGDARFSFPVQNRPGLIGVRLFHQVLGLDTNQAVLLTNGFAAQVY